MRGMRIRVKGVLEMLAGGAKEEEILTNFPDLQREDIHACIAYAARYLESPRGRGSVGNALPALCTVAARARGLDRETRSLGFSCSSSWAAWFHDGSIFNLAHLALSLLRSIPLSLRHPVAMSPWPGYAAEFRRCSGKNGSSVWSLDQRSFYSTTFISRTRFSVEQIYSEGDFGTSRFSTLLPFRG